MFLSCVLLSAVPASALHHPVAVRPVCHTVRAQVPLLTLNEDVSKSMKAIPPPQNVNMAGLSGSVVPTRSFEAAVGDIKAAETTDEYRRGLATVAFITLLFASNSPALRAAFTTAMGTGLQRTGGAWLSQQFHYKVYQLSPHSGLPYKPRQNLGPI